MDPRLVSLLRDGLSPAEAVDYIATTDDGYSQAEWGRVRGVGRKAVHKNVRAAEHELARASKSGDGQ